MTSFITITAMDVERMRKKFNKDMEDHLKLKPNKPAWTPERIADVIAKIDMYNSRDPATRESKQYYYYFSKYDVKTVNGKKVLIPKNQTNELGQIISTDEYFDIIMRVHLETGHGGRQKMFHHLKGDLFIPSIIMGMFPRHCQICTFKKALQRGWGAAMLHDHKIGYAYIIDMTMTPDNSDPNQKYRYILHYLDQTTKFSVIRALATDSVDETASELLKIFLEVGGPALLVSRNSGFTRQLISAILMLYPKCNILAALKTTRDTEQERCQIAVKENVISWMEENKSSTWSLGIYSVANSLNNTYDAEIERTPHEAMYGYKQKNGLDLTSKGIPTEVAQTLKTENDLKNCLERITPQFQSKIKPKTRSGPKVGDSLDSEYPWCWVCEYEDEDVAFLCHRCSGAIHEDCGKYNGLMEITCNSCLQSRASIEAVEVKAEPPTMNKEEAAEMLYVFCDTDVKDEM